jgi:cytochrome c oxidase assembly protein subunit 15
LKHVAKDQSAGRILLLWLHSGNTFLLLAMLSLTAMWLSNGNRSFRFSRKWREVSFIGVTLFATMLAGITGAVAALADTLFPSTSLRSSLMQDFGSLTPALLHSRIFHPAAALITACYVLWIVLRTSTSRNRFSRSAIALITLLFTQVVIGMTNVLLLAPVWVQIAHLFVADALWILLVSAAADLVLEGAKEGRQA